MQKVVGAFLGLVLVRIVLPMLLGPVGMLYLVLSVVGKFLIFLTLWGWSVLNKLRLNRASCDNALYYARRKRQALKEPDFQKDDLLNIGRARKRGDFQTVYSIIASANKRLLDEKSASERLASTQAQAQRAAEINRPAEIRLYRA